MSQDLAVRDFDRLINVLRDETGTMGRTEAKSRELAWWNGRFGTRLDVSIVPADGRTQVRLAKRTTRSTLLAVAGSVAVIGFGVCVSTVSIVFEIAPNADAFAATLGLTSGAAAAFYTARTFIRFFRRRAEVRLRSLGDALVARVRDHAQAVERPKE